MQSQSTSGLCCVTALLQRLLCSQIFDLENKSVLFASVCDCRALQYCWGKWGRTIIAEIRQLPSECCLVGGYPIGESVTLLRRKRIPSFTFLLSLQQNKFSGLL